MEAVTAAAETQEDATVAVPALAAVEVVAEMLL